MARPSKRLIETDDFPFEFVSKLGERESWRKEIHRPVYYLHKWWAKRLGSVFRGILLGCQLGDKADLSTSFYAEHSFSDIRVFDPFMGSGTTVGEAHKLGFTALGRDINPVAVDSVRAALGPLDRNAVERTYEDLEMRVGKEILRLYRSKDSRNRPCDVLYNFWVMQANCPGCAQTVDLFSSFVFAKNAYPRRKPEVRIVCPDCGDIFDGLYDERTVTCSNGHRFVAHDGPVQRSKAVCGGCRTRFKIIDAVGGRRPDYRLYAKLVLTCDGEKEYLPITEEDLRSYAVASRRLRSRGDDLPTLQLAHGFNTRQAMKYGFRRWTDFFNDRQLLALLTLRDGILEIPDPDVRHAFLTLFSGALEFNNMFASYKGEGTGAVRHMFSHHILKPQRTPIEANVWGTPRSSGAFSNLYRSRMLRAISYREHPTEVAEHRSSPSRVCSAAFTGSLSSWNDKLPPRAIALSQGDSSATGLPAHSIDLVVTDPPFFDNVHYSELADFFRAWETTGTESTRAPEEVQDADAERFEEKLRRVFRECHRVLKDEGLLVFSYHHSRPEGWRAVSSAVLDTGFVVVNAHPVKSEMSVATPKSQAKDPIQLDIIIVCRKLTEAPEPAARDEAAEVARRKVGRLLDADFCLSRNDRRIIFYGQLLTTVRNGCDWVDLDDAWLSGDPTESEPQVPSNQATEEGPQLPLFAPGK